MYGYVSSEDKKNHDASKKKQRTRKKSATLESIPPSEKRKDYRFGISSRIQTSSDTQKKVGLKKDFQCNDVIQRMWIHQEGSPDEKWDTLIDERQWYIDKTKCSGDRCQVTMKFEAGADLGDERKGQEYTPEVWYNMGYQVEPVREGIVFKGNFFVEKIEGGTSDRLIRSVKFFLSTCKKIHDIEILGALRQKMYQMSITDFEVDSGEEVIPYRGTSVEEEIILKNILDMNESIDTLKYRFRYIGSGGAADCVIVIAYNREQKRGYAIHATRDTDLKKMMTDMVKISAQEFYLASQMVGVRNNNPSICPGLLRQICDLFAAAGLNVRHINSKSLMLDVKEGSVFTDLAQIPK